MKAWKSAIAIGISIAMLLPIGCSKGGLEKVTIAEVTHSVFYAPQYVAASKGFFEEEKNRESTEIT